MLIETDLTELLGGHTPPDLIERTIARLHEPQVPAAPAQQAPARGRMIVLRRLAEAACVVLAIGLIAWLLWPQTLPATVSASAEANYVVRDDHIELKSGWLKLETGAPDVRRGEGRAGNVRGRAVVGAAIPDETAAAALAAELGLSETETNMLKQPTRWLVASGLALCLFSGQAEFNGEVVIAQEAPDGARVEDPRPAPETTGGFKVLREWTGANSGVDTRSFRVITDDKAWTALWAEHVVREADERVNIQVPEVDFETEMVIAAFAGSSVNSRGFYVHELLAYGAHIIVRLDEHTYQSMGAGANVTPFGLFVVPASLLNVVVEENVQGLLNKPPLWKEVARKPMLGIPSVQVMWARSFMRTEVGGPGGSDFRVITNVEQWDRLITEIGVMDEIWPAPDFSKSVAFAAFGTRLKGLTGQLELTTLGMNAGRIVLRLSSPVAQTADRPQFENLYGVWLFPATSQDIVLERPVLSMTEPTRWQESGVFANADVPFGVKYVESGLDGGAEQPAFGRARSQEEFTRLCETMAIRKKRDANWVNWQREEVIVVLAGEMRTAGGAHTTTTTQAGVHTITYHLYSTSGEDPGLHRPYLIIKVPKSSATIVLKQSRHAGPAPADVKEVARLE